MGLTTTDANRSRTRPEKPPTLAKQHVSQPVRATTTGQPLCKNENAWNGTAPGEEHQLREKHQKDETPHPDRMERWSQFLCTHSVSR